jgi:hypothetical protein
MNEGSDGAYLVLQVRVYNWMHIFFHAPVKERQKL